MRVCIRKIFYQILWGPSPSLPWCGWQIISLDPKTKSTNCLLVSREEIFVLRHAEEKGFSAIQPSKNSSSRKRKIVGDDRDLELTHIWRLLHRHHLSGKMLFSGI